MLPTATTRQPPAPSAGQALRRLGRPSQMDWEYTTWFIVQLLTAPKTAYRHVAYHRQTKLQWARDDPALAVVLAAGAAGVAAAHAVGAGGGLGGAARAAARAVVLDFALVGAAAATAGWAAAAAVGGSGGGGSRGDQPPSSSSPANTPPAGVEWLYAFDVHVNAAIPVVLVAAAGYVLSPWLLRPGAFPALAAALLWAGGAVHYCYLTCLGYSAVGPSSARAPEAALYPGMAAAVVLPLAALLAGVNPARVGVGLLYGAQRAA